MDPPEGGLAPDASPPEVATPAGDAAPAAAHELSTALEALSTGDAASLPFGEIVDGLETQGNLGAVLFVFTALVLLPLPPGPSMIIALPLLVITPQLMFGRTELWLPGWLSKHLVQRRSVAKVIDRLLPPLRWIEQLGRPRLLPLTGALGVRLMGVVATGIALVEVSPLPLSTVMPALALLLLSVGLTRRDGVLVLWGYGMTGVAGGVLLVGAQVLALVFHLIKGWF
jgi:hypothetical protein